VPWLGGEAALASALAFAFAFAFVDRVAAHVVDIAAGS
jgi:hypothetical protein